jgi:hypothetical protein
MLMNIACDVVMMVVLKLEHVHNVSTVLLGHFNAFPLCSLSERLSIPCPAGDAWRDKHR